MPDLQNPKMTDLGHHFSTDGSAGFTGITLTRILGKLFLRPYFALSRGLCSPLSCSSMNDICLKKKILEMNSLKLVLPESCNG